MNSLQPKESMSYRKIFKNIFSDSTNAKTNEEQVSTNITLTLTSLTWETSSLMINQQVCIQSLFFNWAHDFFLRNIMKILIAFYEHLTVGFCAGGSVAIAYSRTSLLVGPSVKIVNF